MTLFSHLGGGPSDSFFPPSWGGGGGGILALGAVLGGRLSGFLGAKIAK